MTREGSYVTETGIADYVTTALERARTVEGLSPDVRPHPLRKVGIVGAGTMGGGIAMNFANVGIRVHVVETKQEALNRGLKIVRANYERSAARGRFPGEEVDVRMAAIDHSLDMSDLADCDLIIEAVYENLELKKSIFAQLDQIAKPGAVLATNTSGLDVDQIAAVTSRPESVIGLHFFSPANVMKLLEIVRGKATGDDVIATAFDMADRIGKVAVLVGVCPGFVGNRMLYVRQLQAHALLQRGAKPWDIDRALKDFGFKMGPFEMSDLAGLDIGWVRGEGDPLRNALCERDRRGQKTRAGYYDYDDNRVGRPSVIVEEIIRDVLAIPADAAPPSDQQVVEFCLFPMVNEGAKILSEGIAQRASDIDVVWLFGYGWPKGNGGPMRWAGDLGLPYVRERLSTMARTSAWLAPVPKLTELRASADRLTA